VMCDSMCRALEEFELEDGLSIVDKVHDLELEILRVL